MPTIKRVRADTRFLLLTGLSVIIAAALAMITGSSTITGSVSLNGQETRQHVEYVLLTPLSAVLIIPIVLVAVAGFWPGDRKSARTVRFVSALLLVCFAIVSAASVGLLFLPAALLMYAAARTWKAPLPEPTTPAAP